MYPLYGSIVIHHTSDVLRNFCSLQICYIGTHPAAEPGVRLSWFAPVALAAVVACSGAPAEGDDSSENVEALVEPTTRVTDAKPGVDVEVTDDALVFPAPLRADVAEAAIGDVLVSGHGAGFCRRVKGRRE